MSDIAQRFEVVAGAFDDRVRGAADGAWNNQSACEGWLARDVVRHLVDWVPGFSSLRSH